MDSEEWVQWTAGHPTPWKMKDRERVVGSELGAHVGVGAGVGIGVSGSGWEKLPGASEERTAIGRK